MLRTGTSRSGALLLAAWIVLSGCSSSEADSTSTTPTVAERSTERGTPSTVPGTTPPPAATFPGFATWDDPDLPLVLDLPMVWRTPIGPPPGLDAVFFVPSDNNRTAERLTLTVEPRQGAASLDIYADEWVRRAPEIYADFFLHERRESAVGALNAAVVRFEARFDGVFADHTVWIVVTDEHVVLFAFIADFAEPGLYLPEVERILSTVRVR